ncbi:hypothetical protein HR060_15615 [Catenovulum sp. SM1970]|uniref:hypothetical protein n=1 Tax=Marinifaba aquimaris TaxID=2741323 RepID=UPI001574815C|nr:hypothetical protein [Marinifaba aquimaris]NTS78279.1 hypothetical protein [Marinifaba aquimaris]
MLNFIKIIKNVVQPKVYNSVLLVALSSIANVSYASSENSSCTQSNEFLTSDNLEALRKYYADVNYNCDWWSPVSKALSLPLVDIDNFEYEGGFRLSAAKMLEGGDQYSTVDFSYGAMTYNPDNNSIFMAGQPTHGGIVEFPVPEIVQSTDVSDFNVSETPLQPYFRFYTQGDAASIELTGISTYFRITGISKVGRSLIVSYINWYDANGSETDTSIVIKDADDLANSEILGPYQIQGAAHASGWITPIPAEWKSILGGSYIVGNQAYAAISSRLSVGPSAFAFYPLTDMVTKQPGPVPTTPLLDFPLGNMLHDTKIYSMPSDRENILANTDRKNMLWTNKSGAAIGFILPGSRSYITIGKSGGHFSGIGYKVPQKNSGTDTPCGGPCSFDARDNYSYYWLWDVADLMKVKYGIMQPYDVRPYSYGIFDVPVDSQIQVSSGAYDPVSKRLFLSFKGGDQESLYNRPPLILTYKSKL